MAMRYPRRLALAAVLLVLCGNVATGTQCKLTLIQMEGALSRAKRFVTMAKESFSQSSQYFQAHVRSSQSSPLCALQKESAKAPRWCGGGARGEGSPAGGSSGGASSSSGGASFSGGASLGGRTMCFPDQKVGQREQTQCAYEDQYQDELDYKRTNYEAVFIHNTIIVQEAEGTLRDVDKAIIALEKICVKLHQVMMDDELYKMLIRHLENPNDETLNDYYRSLTDHEKDEDLNVFNTAEQIFESVSHSLTCDNSFMKTIASVEIKQGLIQSLQTAEFELTLLRDYYDIVLKNMDPCPGISDGGRGHDTETSCRTKASLSLKSVCNALGQIKFKRFAIGVQFGISFEKLEDLISEANDNKIEPLMAVVDYWLNGNVDDVPLTWDSVVESAGGNHVDMNKHSREIDEDHKFLKDPKSDGVASDGETSLVNLGPQDYQTVCQELTRVAYRWANIGVMLGIPFYKLMELRAVNNIGKSLESTIKYWLSNPEGSVHSWWSIVEALSSDYVGEPALARKMKHKFCTGSSRPVETQADLEQKFHPRCYAEIPGKERAKYLNKLQKEATHIQALFAGVKLRAVESIEQNSETLEKLVYAIKSFCKLDLQHCTSVIQVFSEIEKYISFVDYELLKFVIDNFSPHLHHVWKCLREFEREVYQFKQRVMIQVPTDAYDSESGSLFSAADKKKYEVKLNDVSIDTLTLEEAVKLKDQISKILSLRVTRLLKIGEGSVLLTIGMLSSDTLDVAFFSYEMKRDLRELNVLSIRFEGWSVDL